MTRSRSHRVSSCKSVRGLAGVVELLLLRTSDESNSGSRMASMVVCTVCAMSVGYSAADVVGCVLLGHSRVGVEVD